ncbi:putative immunity protein [Plantactinospora soyae]|uniref:Imm-5-like domain-containing protein n=1 Tax=Plantactinospora soyae TaxID=1544732 RepID=A0A927MCN9_9ACTN|nr:hypothetical protein [Plantactinospora soyae]MBE1490691.1 hypothetical protein [Plantactinospora soyae]
MKRYSREHQRLMATWAAGCAERVLPLFERAHPEDGRPRRAIEVCRSWVDTGVFRMAEIRGASLDAHAAARTAKGNDDAACFAARAAGQAVATAHVPQHAFGGSYYALKAVAAADREQPETAATTEREWQAQQLSDDLKQEFLARVIIETRRTGIFITVRKDEDF